MYGSSTIRIEPATKTKPVVARSDKKIDLTPKESGIFVIRGVSHRVGDFFLAGQPAQLAILKQEEFQARRRPEGNDLFAWSDRNDDGKIQPDEVTPDLLYEQLNTSVDTSTTNCDRTWFNT